MQKKANIIFRDQQFFILGDLHFSNVMSLYEKSLIDFNHHELVINFSELNSTDSSGLALIIEWLKFAKQKNKRIQFSHFPEQLLLIAKAAGIEEMFKSVTADL